MSWFKHKPLTKRKKSVPHRTPGPIAKQAWEKFKDSVAQSTKTPEKQKVQN